MPRAKKFKLIRDPEKLRELSGGRWSRNPKFRCNQCEGIVLKARVDRGAAASPRREEIGRWCPECRHFFKIRRVTKTVPTYADWDNFDEERGG